MSKKKRGKKVRLPIEITPQSNNRMMERAEVAEILYNTLNRVAPEDIDGVKRAYVDIEDNSIEISTPDTDRSSEIASFYGMKPVAVADTVEPFPLIKTYEGPVQFEGPKKFNRGMIREILGRIVDEA